MGEREAAVLTILRGFGRRTDVMAVLALALPLLFMGIVYFGPAINVGSVSFYDGGAVYHQVLQQESTWRVLRHTLIFSAQVTLLTLLIAFPLACVATRARPGWAAVIIFVSTMPLWTSLLVRTIAWQGILGRGGVVDSVVGAVFGMEGLVLSPNSFGSVTGSVYVMVPYMFLVLYAALSALPPNLVEAAMTLGASRAQAFISVFLPSAMRGVGAGVLLVFILSVGFFVPPALLGGPSDRTIAMLIQQRVNSQADFPA